MADISVREWSEPDKYVFVLDSSPPDLRPQHGNIRDIARANPGGRCRFKKAGKTSKQEQMKPTLISMTLQASVKECSSVTTECLRPDAY